MAAPQTAARHQAAQQALTLGTLTAAARLWGTVGGSLTASWRSVGPRMWGLVFAAQVEAARAAAVYVPTVLAEQDIDADPVGEVVPEAFAGMASDGRPLDSLLGGALAAVAARQAAGAATPEALGAGWEFLKRVIRTQVPDAGREAASVATAARPAVQGHVRYLRLPSCGRCTVLAGRFYRWSDGFLRHENCDCVMLPTNEAPGRDLVSDPMDAFRRGDVRGLSQDDEQAVRDGADLGQVVNVRRKKAGLSRAGRVLERGGRLTPEGVYHFAGDDRDEAIRLLRQFGYLT